MLQQFFSVAQMEKRETKKLGVLLGIRPADERDKMILGVLAVKSLLLFVE